MKNKVKEQFAKLYNKPCRIYSSAGRINIIGEHTDYNGGFVLPGAVDTGIAVAIAANGSDKVSVYAEDFDKECVFGFDESDAPAQSWAKYIFGVCREMIKHGAKIGGFDAVFSGDVPLGAGMSSSAALESSFAFALNDMFGCGFSLYELAKIGQATEHNYVGVKCGIMDQFASCHGKAGYLMRLDCKDGSFEYIPFNPEAHGYRVVLVDSRVKHDLVDSPYNRRRESCERALKAIQVLHPEAETLRDAKHEWLEEVASKISQKDYIRASFAIEESQRVLDACKALQEGKYEVLGSKMYQTHIGLSAMYEVSCEELDFLTEVARECGVSGSRIMGGGFGGCTINLVKSELYDNFITTAHTKFKEKYGIECKIYPVVISDGARRVE